MAESSGDSPENRRGIPKEWISTRRSDPDVIRRRHGTVEMLALLDSMQPGDELRSFRSPQRTWANRCGRRGYVVTRDGEIIGYVRTAMN